MLGCVIQFLRIFTTIVMYSSAREVIAQSNQLLEAARNAINNPNNPDNQQRLQQVGESKTLQLNTMVSTNIINFN